MKHYFILAVFFMALVSCNQPQVESVRIEKFRIDTLWKRPIVGVDDEINPNSYFAKLSNGDTVPVGANSRIGDTIEYKFIKFKKATK
jgi:hypothetical protein